MKIEAIEWPCGCKAVPRDITNREVKQSWATAWQLVHCPLHVGSEALWEGCKTAAALLVLCQLPPLDEHVASNEALIQGALDALNAAIAEATPKSPATEGTKCTNATNTPATA